MHELLEWQDGQQIRWQGTYEVLQVAETRFSCQLARFRLDIEGQQIMVEYLAEKGFMLQAQTISSMQLIAQ